MLVELLIALFICVGGIFILVGSIGLVRLPTLFMRLHGPTKATTMGIGSLLLASVVFFGAQESGGGLHEILITLFIFITAPVSAYLIGRATLHLQRFGSQASVEPHQETDRPHLP